MCHVKCYGLWPQYTVAAKLRFMEQEMGTWHLKCSTQHIVAAAAATTCPRGCWRCGISVCRAMAKRCSTLTHDSVFIYIFVIKYSHNMCMHQLVISTTYLSQYTFFMAYKPHIKA